MNEGSLMHMEDTEGNGDGELSIQVCVHIFCISVFYGPNFAVLSRTVGVASGVLLPSVPFTPEFGDYDHTSNSNFATTATHRTWHHSDYIFPTTPKIWSELYQRWELKIILTGTSARHSQQTFTIRLGLSGLSGR